MLLQLFSLFKISIGLYVLFFSNNILPGNEKSVCLKYNYSKDYCFKSKCVLLILKDWLQNNYNFGNFKSQISVGVLFYVVEIFQLILC